MNESNTFKKNLLVIIAFFLITGCSSTIKFTSPPTLIYQGYGNKTGSDTLNQLHKCSIGVVPSQKSLAIALQNDGDFPLKTNPFADRLSMVDTEGKTYEISLSVFTNKITNYYHSIILNPNSKAAPGSIQIKDPAILHAIQNGQVKAFVYKLGVSGISFTLPYAYTMEPQTMDVSRKTAQKIYDAVNS